MAAQSKSVWQEIREAIKDGWAEVRALRKDVWGRLQPVWQTRIVLAARMALAVIIVTALAGGLAIYGLGWENRFTRFVGAFVPYPAAVSLQGFVPYSQYASEAERIKVYAKQTGIKIDDKTRNQQAMSQRLNALIIERLAAQKKVTVSSQELGKEYNRIMQAYGGEKATLDILRKQYGMSKADYRALIHDQLLSQKAEAAWAKDEASLADTRDQASSIVRQAEGGADFDQLANRYSQDVATASGNNALIDAATLPDNVATAVKEVKDGEVVVRPIQVDQSYYIVKRVKTDGDKVMVRGIVVKPTSFGKRVADELAGAHAVRLLWPAR